MGVPTTVILLILLLSLSLFLGFQASKKTPRLTKYVPSIALIIGILFLFVKLQLNLNAHAFDGIYDVLGMIFLSCLLAVFFGIALVLEVRDRVKVKN